MNSELRCNLFASEIKTIYRSLLNITTKTEQQTPQWGLKRVDRLNIPITKWLLWTVTSVTRSLTEVASEWQWCPTRIHHEPVGKTQSKPKLTLRLWQRADSSRVPLLFLYFFASRVLLSFRMYIQKKIRSVFILHSSSWPAKGSALKRHTDSISTHMMPSQSSLHHLTSPGQFLWWKTAKRKHYLKISDPQKFKAL